MGETVEARQDRQIKEIYQGIDDGSIHPDKKKEALATLKQIEGILARKRNA